ncbi:MAG: hypothetical protein EKK64_03540 [Neisseriaceae bacterium]|nr:MAG: hypothetical protein EKK64_03540 [Neisseriaceae bacterium]
MKTFHQSLRITNNVNLAKGCFYEMQKNGVNPCDFVTWLEDFLKENNIDDLVEESKNWLNNQLSLQEGILDRMGQGFNSAPKPGNPSPLASKLGSMAGNAAQWAGNKLGSAISSSKDAYNQFNKSVDPNNIQYQNNHLQNMQQNLSQMQNQQPQKPDASAQFSGEFDNAAAALNNLHKRMGVSKDLLNNLGGMPFMTAILSLIQILKNKNMGDIVAQESYRQEENIKELLESIQSYGVDVERLADWMVSKLETIEEGFLDKAGEWLGNQWANVKGAFNRWTGGESQKWGFDADSRVKFKNAEAIQNALQALSGLQSKLGNNMNPVFKNSLDQILSSLQNNVQQQAQPQNQAQQQPQQQPQQTQQPTQPKPRYRLQTPPQQQAQQNPVQQPQQAEQLPSWAKNFNYK